MDDVIDQMNGIVNVIVLYEVIDFVFEMCDMVGIVVEVVWIIVEVILLFCLFGLNVGWLYDLIVWLIQIEGYVDDIYDVGIWVLFYVLKGIVDLMVFIIWCEIYSSLEKIVDCFEDVVNEIQGLVIDYV